MTVIVSTQSLLTRAFKMLIYKARSNPRPNDGRNVIRRNTLQDSLWGGGGEGAELNGFGCSECHDVVLDPGDSASMPSFLSCSQRDTKNEDVHRDRNCPYAALSRPPAKAVRLSSMTCLELPVVRKHNCTRTHTHPKKWKSGSNGKAQEERCPAGTLQHQGRDSYSQHTPNELLPLRDGHVLLGQRSAM